MTRVATMATLAVLVVAMTAAMMVPAGAAGEATARCDEGRWPATVQAKPKSFEPGGRAGFYVWHDSRGWHLRTTTPERRPHLFSGTIVSSGDIRLVHHYRDEGRDTVTVNGNALTFRFVTYAGVDGVDFTAGCTESLGFSLEAFDRMVPASRIWLGLEGNATGNPFTVHRVG